MRAVLRVDGCAPFLGAVRAGRTGLWWRRRWSPNIRRVGWGEVEWCEAGPDRRLGVERHTHRLVVEFDGGSLEVLLRGPWGAIALVELRDAIQARARLVADEAHPGRRVRCREQP